jgi:hypothetical protein
MRYVSVFRLWVVCENFPPICLFRVVRRGLQSPGPLLFPEEQPSVDVEESGQVRHERARHVRQQHDECGQRSRDDSG